MTFRRSSDDAVNSARWLARNRAELAARGIPSEILDNARAWNYTLLHGDDALGSGWSVTWLSQDQCRSLLTLLSKDLTSDVGLDLVRKLRQIVDAET